MNWLEALLSRAERLWPWTRVKPWQRAIRTTYIPWKGVRVAVMLPGIARHLWFFDEIDVCDMREDTENLATQSVTTTDDWAVSFSASFTYEIEDAEKQILNVRESASSLRDLAMIHLSERIRELSWIELLASQKELERSLRGTMTTRARDWGVKITRVGITDLVKARQFRHFGELSTG